MKKILTGILPDIAAILLFAAVSIIYMFPAMQGKTLAQHDSTAGIGAGEEASEYFDRTGERTRWTNSLFSGMPTYQMSPSYPAYDILNPVERVYHLFLPGYVWYIFAMMLGFYILMRVLSCNVFVSILGALIWTFSSYFFIIISAGHLWKIMTLAYIPPTIAGMVLIYRDKRLLGAVLTAFFVALQIKSNHIQMSYYFLFVMAALFIAFAVEAVKSKRMKQFFISTAILFAAGITGVAVNASNLYHTYQYSKETTRGGSELTGSSDSADKTKGLDRDYITAWSYGLDETFTLLVPNAKGGSTSKGDYVLPMSDSKVAMRKADKEFLSFYRQLPQYWGEQPMTAGPVYVGAFVCLLFVLGLLIVTGPVKWALLAVTILSILLSWGHNFQWFTDLFIDYFPLYSKFRTVSSILVIAEFTIPLLAILGLVEFLRTVNEGTLCEKNYCGGKLSAKSAFYTSFGIIGGLAALFAAVPGILGSVISTNEWYSFNDIAKQYADAGYKFPLETFVANLSEMRHAMITSDALRSLLFILAGSLVLILVARKRMKTNIAVVLLTLICLVDMWNVNLRYLSPDMFKIPSAKEAEYQLTDTDKKILEDKSLSYRVLNLASDTFNENHTSYYHKSIGGYHAAKLRRYQELTNEYIIPEMKSVFSAMMKSAGDGSSIESKDFPVINMLNTRYLIFPGNDGETVPVLYPFSCGNAWFVSELIYVGTADQEFDALHHINPANTAVVDKRFADNIQGLEEGRIKRGDDSDILLTEYEPNRLVYEVNSSTGGLAVFSEIYYPGWTAELDGNEIPIGRADYVLRCASIPAGKHTLVMEFNPKSLHVTDTVSIIALVLMVLGLVCALTCQCFIKSRKQKKI